MNKSAKIIIIGGGIIGTSLAYELSVNGFTQIILLEKNESIPGLNQSSTNEGSIHSGIFYPVSVMPLKASLCVKGNNLMYEFLEKFGLPYKKTGKLIIASNTKEEKILDFFYSVGLENKVPAIKMLDKETVKKLEPNLENVKKAILVPSCGSASAESLILKLKSLSENNGVSFVLGTKVKTIVPEEKSFKVKVKKESREKEFEAELVINCAGLYSDEIAKMVNPDSSYQIAPVRGEFAAFDSNRRKNIHLSGMHIYNPPYFYKTAGNKMEIVDLETGNINTSLKEGKIFVTVGAHLSPAYGKIGQKFLLNKYTISPLKTTGVSKDDYTTNLHPKKDFIEKIKYIFPNLYEEDIALDHTGIMAPLKDFRDFVIQKDRRFPNFINLIGMESPAWTASLAIAKYVHELLY